MTGPEAFGLELRRARERKGLTLEQVSEQTKVSVSHFAGLERADISRWPAGIFARSFIRGYAGAVGLDPEELVAEFARVYPESPDGRRIATHAVRPSKEDGERPDVPPESEGERSAFRLVLDPSVPAGRQGGAGRAARRVAAGVVDVLIPLAVAGAAASVAGREWFWLAAACVGVAGHVGFFGLTGATPGVWLSRYRSGAASAELLTSRSRRRADADMAQVVRRHVPRHPSSRHSGHAHRMRH